MLVLLLLLLLVLVLVLVLVLLLRYSPFYIVAQFIYTVIYSALSSKFLTRVNKWWCFDIFAAHHDGAWRARIRVSAFAARKSSQIYHSYIASERGGE